MWLCHYSDEQCQILLCKLATGTLRNKGSPHPEDLAWVTEDTAKALAEARSSEAVFSELTC